MLTSLQNPLVKHMRKLHHAKGRRSHQVFLVEGTHLIQEALAVGYPLTVVCCTEAWQARYANLWQQLNQLMLERLEIVSPEVLAAMATTVHPDGIVAIAPRLTETPAIDQMDKAEPEPLHQGSPLDLQAISLGLVLDTIQDPGNLGTMIRTAAAANCDGLWLSQNSVDPDHPKVLRASAGQWFRTPLTICADVPIQIRQLQTAGIQVIATSPTAPLSYWDLDLRSPTVFLLGNEGAGLGATLTDLADQTVHIPVAPSVESLNVAIATALLLYEAQRQRRGLLA